MNARLDPEIGAALDAMGLRHLSCERLSAICSPELDRITYRIDLAPDASVRTIKARRFESEAAALEQSEIRRALPADFSAVLLRHGRVLLEEWVEGRVLGAEATVDQLREAGRLLANLHARNSLGELTLPRTCTTKEHRRSAIEALRQASRAGVLGGGQAARLARGMRLADPGQARCGLVHFDFCGENIVVDATGRLRVVDNERVHVDAVEFDLARAWYRWRLPQDAWRSFHASYATAFPCEETEDTVWFWRTVAVSRALALRLRVAPRMMDAPLASLHQLTHELSA